MYFNACCVVVNGGGVCRFRNFVEEAEPAESEETVSTEPIASISLSLTRDGQEPFQVKVCINVCARVLCVCVCVRVVVSPFFNLGLFSDHAERVFSI